MTVKKITESVKNQITGNTLNIALFVAGLWAINKLIHTGSNVFDTILGEDPLGAVGGDTTEDAGWLTSWYSHTSGNPDAEVWDPIGIFGPPSFHMKFFGEELNPFEAWF